MYLKKLSILIGTFIVFYTIVCSTTSSLNIEQNILSKTNIKPKFGEGGNPEVKNKVNHCLTLKSHIQIECLEKLYPHDQNILIHPSHGKHIKLATRNMGNKRQTLQLKEEIRILLYIDKSYVPISLKYKLKDNHITQDKK